MGGKKNPENSKKAAGQARKADAAAKKAAAEETKREQLEAESWSKGAKNNAKKETETAKKAQQAQKKAERDALLAEEEKQNGGRAQPKNNKTAVKKINRGLDLSQLDSPSESLATISASGIDSALEALTLTSGAASDIKVDRHPERRFKAAHAQFEERRLQEMEADGSGQGLRLNQKKDKIRKEFEKSPENPFNQATARFDSTKEDLSHIRQQEKDKIEKRLASH